MFRKPKPVPSQSQQTAAAAAAAPPSPKPGRQYRSVLPDASVIGIAVVV